MKDQYFNAVPADLAVLPSFNLLSDAEREYVFEQDWYEANGVLMADMPELGGDSPRDAGLEVDEDGNLVGVEVLYIANILKRANADDGFYHA